MKKFLFITSLIAALLLGGNAQAGVKIVVLGSSTAAGSGVTNSANAWVNRYSAYLQTLDPTNQVINLAKGGYTTCAIMPTGTPDYNTGSHILSVDTERNIDKALSYNPGAIIINMPTNDVSNGIPVDTQMEHFATVIDMAEAAGVKCWITTSQPHNYGEMYEGPYGDGKEPDPYKQTARDQFKELTERILATYGERAIDFYNGIATEDGYSFIRPEYNSGDGVHLNDEAHAVLFERVKEKNIPSQIDDSFGGVLANPVYVNFGPISEAAVENWNFVNAQNTGGVFSPLIDFAGVATSLSLTLVEGFTNAATNGSASDLWGMDDAISTSNFSSTGTPVIEFAGLSPAQVYDFEVFASRTAPDPRTCIYTFVGSDTVTVSLDAASNTSNTALARQVVPDELGKVTLTITRDTTNSSGYCYINAMKITSASPAVVIPEGAINVETAGTLASLLDEPVDEITELVLYGSLNGTDIALIMQMSALTDLDMEHARIVAGGDAYLNGMHTRDNVFPQEMFYKNTVIRRVVLPSTITQLLYHTFMGATALEEVYIPDGVTSFGNDLFSGCTNLKVVNIPDGLQTMGTGCFYNCKGITSLAFPEGLTVLPGGTFYGCSALESLTLPMTLTAIEGDWTFSGCSALKSLVLGPEVAGIAGGVFYNCWSLNDIYCYMTELPVIDTKNGESPFAGAFKPEYCTLHVPFAACDTYKADAVWGVMANYVSLATVTADGSVLEPGAAGLQALAGARDIVIAGATPDAALLQPVLAGNMQATTIDLTGVTEYAQLLTAGNPNCLTYTAAENPMEGDNVVVVAADGSATAASLVLQAGYDFGNTRTFTAATAQFSRVFDYGWHMLALPFAAPQGEGAWIEYFDKADGENVSFTTVEDGIRAGEVTLIRCEKDGLRTFEASNVEVAATTVAAQADVPLVATWREETDFTGKYTLQTRGENTYFVPATGTIPAFSGYAVFEGSPAEMLVVHGNIPSAEGLTATEGPGIYAAGQRLYVRSSEAFTLPVYALDGTCVRMVEVVPGTTIVEGLQPGIYLAGKAKVVISY